MSDEIMAELKKVEVLVNALDEAGKSLGDEVKELEGQLERRRAGGGEGALGDAWKESRLGSHREALIRIRGELERLEPCRKAWVEVLAKAVEDHRAIGADDDPSKSLEEALRLKLRNLKDFSEGLERRLGACQEEAAAAGEPPPTPEELSRQLEQEFDERARQMKSWQMAATLVYVVVLIVIATVFLMSVVAEANHSLTLKSSKLDEEFRREDERREQARTDTEEAIHRLQKRIQVSYQGLTKEAQARLERQMNAKQEELGKRIEEQVSAQLYAKLSNEAPQLAAAAISDVAQKEGHIEQAILRKVKEKLAEPNSQERAQLLRLLMIFETDPRAVRELMLERAADPSEDLETRRVALTLFQPARDLAVDSGDLQRVLALLGGLADGEEILHLEGAVAELLGRFPPQRAPEIGSWIRSNPAYPRARIALHALVTGSGSQPAQALVGLVEGDSEEVRQLGWDGLSGLQVDQSARIPAGERRRLVQRALASSIKRGAFGETGTGFDRLDILQMREDPRRRLGLIPNRPSVLGGLLTPLLTTRPRTGAIAGLSGLLQLEDVDWARAQIPSSSREALDLLCLAFADRLRWEYGLKRDVSSRLGPLRSFARQLPQALQHSGSVKLFSVTLGLVGFKHAPEFYLALPTLFAQGPPHPQALELLAAALAEEGERLTPPAEALLARLRGATGELNGLRLAVAELLYEWGVQDGRDVGRLDRDAAIRYLERAVSLDSSSRNRRELFQMLLQRGRTEEALEQVEAILDDPAGRVDLGMALECVLHAGENEALVRGAVKRSEALQGSDHDRASARENLGVYLVRQRRWREAFEHTEEVQKLSRQTPWNWLLRAIAADRLLQAGDQTDERRIRLTSARDLALKQWELLKTYPSEQRLRRYLGPLMDGYSASAGE